MEKPCFHLALTSLIISHFKLGVHKCPFKDVVATKATSTPEYLNVSEANKVCLQSKIDTLIYLPPLQDLIAQVGELTGIEDNKLEYFTYIRDTLFIEKLWAKMPDGIDGAMFEKIDHLADIVDDFMDGIGLEKMDGIDFSVEFPRQNGGPLLWSIIDHMNLKRHCLDKAAGKSMPSTPYISAYQHFSQR